jgi:hypothetical protein
MDDMMVMMRMLGGGWFGSAIDMSGLIAFLVFGVVYLLIPVLGYQTERPAGFALALYAMIAFIAISLVQLLAQWVLILDQGGAGMFGRGESLVHILMLFAILKIVVFLVAMLAFVSGLRRLKIYHLPPDAQ